VERRTSSRAARSVCRRPRAHIHFSSAVIGRGVLAHENARGNMTTAPTQRFARESTVESYLAPLHDRAPLHTRTSDPSALVSLGAPPPRQVLPRRGEERSAFCPRRRDHSRRFLQHDVPQPRHRDLDAHESPCVFPARGSRSHARHDDLHRCAERERLATPSTEASTFSQIERADPRCGARRSCGYTPCRGPVDCA